MADVAARLLDPSAAMAAQLATTIERLAVAVRPAALELRRLLDGDLAGMVDGPSTVELDPDVVGVVVDLSAFKLALVVADSEVLNGDGHPAHEPTPLEMTAGLYRAHRSPR